MEIPSRRESARRSTLKGRVSRRMQSYANRFNLPESDSLIDRFQTPDELCVSWNLQFHLSTCYQHILDATDPSIALIRAIHGCRIHARESNSRLKRLHLIDDQIAALMHHGGYTCSVDEKGELKISVEQLESDLIANTISSEMKVYITQLRSAREQLMLSVSTFADLRHQTDDKMVKWIQWISKHVDDHTHRVYLESELREYAASVRNTTTEYKRCVSDIDKFRLAVQSLESEVHGLIARKTHLERVLGAVDIEAVVARYETLGNEKVSQMESVTDAVQELARQLAHKRNILAPKLNELNTLRTHLNDQERLLRERAWKCGSGESNETSQLLAKLRSRQTDLLHEMSEVRFEIDFLKQYIDREQNFCPQFPDLNTVEVSRVLINLRKLSSLLHNKSS